MLNEMKKNSLSIKNSDELSAEKEAAATVTTESTNKLDDGQASTRSTYESFSWLFAYTQMFSRRLFKDLLVSLIGYFYSGHIVPDHIVDLISVQKSLRAERESQSITYTRDNETGLPYCLSAVKNFFNTFTKYLLCSEDDIALQNPSYKSFEHKDKEPIFVIVDSSCVSNPSSRELLVENRKETAFKKTYNRNVIPIGVPSTSRDIREHFFETPIQPSESNDELEMIEINLQSENEILIDNEEVDGESIVISYLQNKDLFLDKDNALNSSKKKSSILEDVPKMETIMEGEQFSSFPLKASTIQLSPEVKSEDPDT